MYIAMSLNAIFFTLVDTKFNPKTKEDTSSGRVKNHLQQNG